MLVLLFTAGLLMGILAKWISILMIRHRKGDVSGSKILGGVYSGLIWALISGTSYLIIGLVFSGDQLKITECAFVLSVCMALSAVDFQVKKIPNELLLTLLVFKIAMLIISKESLFDAIFGMLFAGVAFLFPAKFGKTIGMGDIKLAMIVGFYLGPVGFVQTMAIMGVCLLIYWGYLSITDKGGLKTSAALGPYISLGFFITLCVSIPIRI